LGYIAVYEQLIGLFWLSTEHLATVCVKKKVKSLKCNIQSERINKS
jgi:hypothetical protein